MCSVEVSSVFKAANHMRVIVPVVIQSKNHFKRSDGTISGNEIFLNQDKKLVFASSVLSVLEALFNELLGGNVPVQLGSANPCPGHLKLM